LRFTERILTFDDEVAERWGRLIGTLAKTGITLQSTDAMLAATALHHDLVIVTRNERHFLPAGLNVLNPFTADEA
jgi:predicted nucleic acid-binding protein